MSSNWSARSPTNSTAQCFKAAWQRLVDRHAVLRTVFHLEGRDEPVQEVHSKVTWDLEESDWRDGKSAGSDLRLDEFLREDRRRPFALDRHPPWRLHLIRCPQGGYRSCGHRTMPCSTADLAASCCRNYPRSIAGCVGEPPRRSSPRLPMKTMFAGSSRTSFESARAYWTDALRGYRGTTRLPQDHADGAPADDEASHLTLECRLTAEQTQALRRRRDDVRRYVEYDPPGCMGAAAGPLLRERGHRLRRRARLPPIVGAGGRLDGRPLDQHPSGAGPRAGLRTDVRMAAGYSVPMARHARIRAYSPGDSAVLERVAGQPAALREHRRLRKRPAR